MDSCDCCGSGSNVSSHNSNIANCSIDLCEFCKEKGHEPKWLIDEVIEETGGLEFCKPWIRKMVSGVRYCVVKGE